MAVKKGNGSKMTVEQYRQMKADDPYKPVVVVPAKPVKKTAKGKK